MFVLGFLGERREELFAGSLLGGYVSFEGVCAGVLWFVFLSFRLVCLMFRTVCIVFWWW